MASGSFEFDPSGYLQGKIDWSSSSNGASANSSNVTAIIYARRTNSYSTWGQSWSGYVKIGSAQTNISFSSSVEVGSSWVEMARVSTTVGHNNDGTGSASISGSVTGPQGTSLSGNTSSGSSTVTLDRIPRYTSITSFSVAKRNETSFTFSWGTADTIDYVWYSTNNGSNWTGYDVTDGTSGSFTVSGLSPNTTYNCKLRVRRKDSQLTTDSSTVSQTTYKVPSQSIKSKTETSITMNWSIDSTANHIWYSKDNGTNWVDVGNVNATSGSYTISGLSANTSYNIKTRVRRSATSTTYDSTASNQTTYNYPYVSAVGTNELEIGESQTLTLYNPLSRSCTVYMKQNSTSGTQLYSGTTSGTSITFTPNTSTLYASIPNNQSGTAVYYCTYSSQTVSTKSGTYKIKGTEIPTFSNFTYKDSNTTVTSITGNDQIMVKGLSTVQVTISSANKMVAQNSATPKNYAMSMSTLSDTANYSTSDIVKELGIINDSGTQRLSVIAYDSRNLSKTAYKDITVYDYNKPVINATITRLNNFENQTTISVKGTYTKLTIDNTNKNTMSLVRYRYRETGGTWNNWVNLTVTVSNGNFTCTNVILALDNSKSFEFEIQATDSLAQTTSITQSIGVGVPILFISSNTKKIGINKMPTGNADLQLAGDIEARNITTSGGITTSGDISTKNITTSGNITVGGQVAGNKGGSWIKGRSNATVKNTKNGDSNFNVVMSQKTKNGSWNIGSLGNDDNLYFSYDTDTNFNNNNNQNTKLTLKPSAGIIATLQMVYPVGSIYISTVSTNPNTLFGFGTWSQLQNRFLIGTGSSYSNGATGGATSVSYTPAGSNTGTAISVDQMPAHSHETLLDIVHSDGQVVTDEILDVGIFWGNGRRRYYANVSNTGGGKTHTHTFNGTKATINTMPPYLAVYMWKRTA